MSTTPKTMFTNSNQSKEFKTRSSIFDNDDGLHIYFSIPHYLGSSMILHFSAGIQY